MWVFPSHVDPPAKINFRVHAPKLTQLVTGQNFHYFKLRLFDIDRYFHFKKSWNHNYPPGQQIYSDTPAACAIRSLISAEHSILYSNRAMRDGNVEGELERSPKALLDLLAQYVDSSSSFSSIHAAIKTSYQFLTAADSKKEEDLQIYTYVLMDRSLRFSRTGAGTSVDASSKHALHAGAVPEVFYAGEFWLEADTNEWGVTIYMDNNSGTFAPPGCDLFKMKLLMEANFPRIPLVMLDYQDPEWKFRRKRE